MSTRAQIAIQIGPNEWAQIADDLGDDIIQSHMSHFGPPVRKGC